MTIYSKILSSFIFFLIVYSSSNSLDAQELLWRYEQQSDVKVVSGYFWIDDQGKGYYNSTKEDPKNPGQYSYHHSLLMLDGDGHYDGSIFLQQCKSGAIVLPIGDKYAMSKVDCNRTDSYKPRSYLINKVGEIEKSGEAFPGNYFSQMPLSDGILYFSKPTNKFSFSNLNLGHLSYDFELSYDSISLQPLKRDNLGMAFNYIDPVLLDDGKIIMPFNYGKVGSCVSIDKGSVFCVDDKKISWQYESEYVLKYIDGINDKVALYLRSYRRRAPNQIVLLNDEGDVLSTTVLLHSRLKAIDMQVSESHILLLTKNAIHWCNWDGDVIKSFDLQEHNISARKMQLLDNGELIITGTYDYNMAIIKLSSILATDTVESKEEEEEEEVMHREISQFDTKLETENIISVSVFPNPTSLNLFFEIEDTDPDNADYQISIFDAKGSQMLNTTFTSNRYNINVSGYIPGSYFYRIIKRGEAQNVLLSGRFIKI